MRKLITVTLIACVISAPAFAQAQKKNEGEKLIELKDGATVLIFKDGKMGMKDKFDRPMSMKEGEPMVTKDGATIMMKGNEVWRRVIKDGVMTP